jgi:hypothetical protein
MFYAGALIVLSLICATVRARAQLETRVTTPFLAVSDPAAFAVADFNHDGKLDIAAVGQELQIFLGNGDGTFQLPINYTVGTSPGSVAVADFNGDGKLDVAVANYLSSNVSVLFGNGDGTFGPPITLNTAIGPFFITAGDFNGDHKPDLIVLTANCMSMFLNDGHGGFLKPITTAPGGSALGVGDFNRDGVLDVAVTRSNDTSAWVSILLGNGDGTFIEGAKYPIPMQPQSVAVADFRGDGRLDLAIPSFFGGVVSVLLGNSDGTFQEASDYTSYFPTWATAGDFNGDGKPDLIVSNLDDDGFSSSSVSILLNNGDGTFQPQIVFPEGQLSNFVGLGDFNGDGRLDVIDMDRWDGYLLTLLNTGTAVFSPATPLTFPSQLIGTKSPPQTTTLTNEGKIPLAISSVVFSGDPFKMSTTCKGSLSPGSQCIVTASFTAQTEGSVTGRVVIRDSASSKPQVIELVGGGTTVRLLPSGLVFPTQKVGTTSPPKTIQLTNTGNTPLTFTHLIFVFGENPSAFSQTNTCGSQVGPGASCDISVTFAPRTTGPRKAYIFIEDDGGGSPQKPTLTGTGD